MSEETRAHFIRDHQGIVIAFMVGVGLIVWAIIAWRVSTTINISHKLCLSIKTLIQPQVVDAHTKGTVMYGYYVKHPKDLARLEKFARDPTC